MAQIKNLEQINQRIKQLNSDLDSIIDSGVLLALQKYQLAYERAIFNKDFSVNESGYLKSTHGNYAKAVSISSAMSGRIEGVAKKHFDQYAIIGNLSIDFANSIGIKTSIEFSDVSAISRLKKIDFSSLYAQSEILDNEIKKQLVNAIALKANLKTTVNNLAENLLGAGNKEGQLARYADTYMRTSLFGLNNAVDHEIYDTMGGDSATAEYLYAGPILDKRIRPFCQSHVGKVFTKKEIETFPLENRSGLNPYLFPGGWNCRHKLILSLKD